MAPYPGHGLPLSPCGDVTLTLHRYNRGRLRCVQTITVSEPAQTEGRVLPPSDTLDGGDVLPGCTASVADIMAQLRETSGRRVA